MSQLKTTVSKPSIALFGEVLIDQFPDGQQILGGAPFNVAWHLQAFGQSPRFISKVGSDQIGADIKVAMEAWGMSLSGLQVDTLYPTGKVAIQINSGEPSYDILDQQAYDFIDANQLDLSKAYDVIYHGSLALRHTVSAQALDTLLNKHQGKVFLDVNLRAPWWKKTAIEQNLQQADWVKLNIDELRQLVTLSNNLKDTMQEVLNLYNLETLIVTSGEQGANALSNSGEFVEVKPAGDFNVVDTVGAGDAFAAVLLLGLLNDWPLLLTMTRAQSFASASVTQRGATFKEIGFYQAFIEAWF